MDTVQPSSSPTPPTPAAPSTATLNMEKAPLESPSPSSAAAAPQDVEKAEEYSDRVLLGQRSYAETIVLCFANLIPPLGVA